MKGLLDDVANVKHSLDVLVHIHVTVLMHSHGRALEISEVLLGPNPTVTNQFIVLRVPSWFRRHRDPLRQGRKPLEVSVLDRKVQLTF
eukprot:5162262-Pyramimonas_sp.AAC.1